MFGAFVHRSFCNVETQECSAAIDVQGEAEAKDLDVAEESGDICPNQSPSNFKLPNELPASTSKLVATGKPPGKNNYRDKLLSNLEKKSTERNDLIKKLISTEDDVDEMDLFFQSIARSAKKLPLNLQHRLKKQTLNTLCDLEEENSQPSYVPSPVGYNTSPSATPSPGAVPFTNNPHISSDTTQYCYSQPVPCFPKEVAPSSSYVQSNITDGYASSSQYMNLD